MRHIEITTILPCPNLCSYCPQDKLMAVYKGDKILSLQKFKEALENIPKDVRIHFSGFSENFFNPKAHEMVEYANDKGYKIHVYTTTRGFDVERMSKIPFEEIHVHNIGSYKHVPYATVVDTISNPISRGGNLFHVEQKKGNLICSRSATFEQNVMLPNGDVYLCCMDWSLKHKLGNIFTTHFDKLKRNKQYKLCQTCEKALQS